MAHVNYRPITEDDKQGQPHSIVVKRAYPDKSGFYDDRLGTPCMWIDGFWCRGNGRVVDEEVIGIEI